MSDPAITTDTIRLHRLVRQVAASRQGDEAQAIARRALIEAMAAVYPAKVFNDPAIWARARWLDGLAFALVGGEVMLPQAPSCPRVP